MTTIFSRTKAEVLTILNTELVGTGIAQEVRTSRGYATVQTPYVVVSTRSYDTRLSDGAHLVYLTIATIAKFEDATEEELAETALDDIEQVLIDCFDEEIGKYQVHKGYWGAVDRDKQSWRPFSPIGPGYRYAEQYFRFVVYGL